MQVLHFAIRDKDLNMAKLLLKHSANVNDAYNGRNRMTPLRWTAEYKNSDVVELFLENGADIDARYRERRTLLITAFLQFDNNTAKLLMKNGAIHYNHNMCITRLRKWQIIEDKADDALEEASSKENRKTDDPEHTEVETSPVHFNVIPLGSASEARQLLADASSQPLDNSVGKFHAIFLVISQSF